LPGNKLANPVSCKPFVNRQPMIVQPATNPGRFRTAMERSRRGPKTSSSGGLESGNVQLCGDTSVTVTTPVRLS
jgi:hypothetical protein